MKSLKLRRFDSIHQLARFWQSHDLTDFEADMEEVAEPVFVRVTPINFNLPENESNAIQRIAKSRVYLKKK